MPRSSSCTRIALWVTLALCLHGCGGGSTAFVAPPPPATPDFLLNFSVPSVTLAQGASSPPVNITVTAENGFTGSVQVTLAGLPAGVTTNPPSPFTLMAGAATPVVFGAAATTAAGNISIAAQGTSGSLTHGANLTLAIQAATASPLPRTTYVRTDSVASLDNPAGEFHHRHIVYDAGHQQVFVANRAMNRIEVFSSVTQARIAQIAVPGVSSVDLSQDGATVWAGSLTERIFAVDPVSLQVTATYTIPPLTPIPGAVFDRPEEVVALAGGKFLVRLRQGATAESLLALWDPAANAPVNLTPAEPQLFQNGLGAIVRSADATRVLVGASDSSGEVALFDSTGNVVAGPRGLGSGTLPLLAANSDGTRFAAVLAANGAPQLYLLDSALNPVAGPLPVSATSLVFSRGGTMLYATQPPSAAPPSAAPVVNVFDARSLALLGQVPDVATGGVGSQVEDADATQMLFALSNRGVGFLDAAKPGVLPLPAPMFATAPAATPSEGPAAGGTALQLNGANFTNLAQLHIGAQVAANVSVASATQLQASSPSSATPGAANVTAYFANGWLALAPDAFSFGPQILQVLPNAGVSAGGDTVQIYGYGLGSDITKISVKIGGVAGTVQSVQNVASISAALPLDATYPFSLECVTVQTPAGTPGNADLAISSAAGAATAPRAFQYLQSVQSFIKPGLYKFIAYDQKRQRIYLSNIDHLDVFDLAAQQYIAPLNSPGGPPPNAGLRGLSVSPDGSQVVVADFGAQSVYLLNPDSGTGITVPVGGVPGFLNSGPARVAATSAQTVFVGLTGEGGQGACSACLGQLNLAVNPPVLQTATQPEVTSITGAPLLQANAAGDHVFVSFGAAPGSPLALWQASSPNQFTVASANSSATDVAASADGATFATQSNGAAEIRAADLSLAALPAAAELAANPARVSVPGIALQPIRRADLSAVSDRAVRQRWRQRWHRHPGRA